MKSWFAAVSEVIGVSTWHGLADFVSFLKASISIGLTIGAALYLAMLTSLDGRYAVKSAEARAEVAVAVAEEQRNALVRLERNLLENQVFETRVRECTEENPKLRREYSSKVVQLLARYHDLVGRYPPLTSCEALQ
jgi:hypothetical protein